MKKKLFEKILELFASLFTRFAYDTTASACIFDFYQPEEPNCLREK